MGRRRAIQRSSYSNADGMPLAIIVTPRDAQTRGGLRRFFPRAERGDDFSPARCLPRKTLRLQCAAEFIGHRDSVSVNLVQNRAG